MNKNKGFSLIEVITTLVIIGILATISVLSFQHYFEQTRNAIRQTDISNIARTLLASQADQEIRPYAFFGDDQPGEPKLSTSLQSNGFKIPTDPGNQCYIYAYHTTLNSQDFFVASANPSTNTLFVEGTGKGIQDAKNQELSILSMIQNNCRATRPINNYSILQITDTGITTVRTGEVVSGGTGGTSIFR